MLLDIVRATRKKGVRAVDAELPPGLYSWLANDLSAADDWALILAGSKEPIRGEVRLIEAGRSINLYRDPKARSEVGLVLARESGPLLGKNVRTHLEAIARLRDDELLLERIELPKSFLGKSQAALDEFDFRRLSLELAFATRSLKSLIIVEPQLHPYQSWAPRISHLNQEGTFIHLLTCNNSRAQLMSSKIIYAETQPPKNESEAFSVRIDTPLTESTRAFFSNMAAEFPYAYKDTGTIIFEPMGREKLARLQEAMTDPSLQLNEWQVVSL